MPDTQIPRIHQVERRDHSCKLTCDVYIHTCVHAHTWEGGGGENKVTKRKCDYEHTERCVSSKRPVILWYEMHGQESTRCPCLLLSCSGFLHSVLHQTGFSSLSRFLHSELRSFWCRKQWFSIDTFCRLDGYRTCLIISLWGRDSQKEQMSITPELKLHVDTGLLHKGE